MKIELLLSNDHSTVELAAGVLLFEIPTRTVLLVQDKKMSWRFPSGRQEPGETSVAAAARELLEETGIGTKSYHLCQLPIPLVRGKKTEHRNALPKLTFLFPAYTLIPKQDLPIVEHELKSTPQWFSIDEAAKITRSSSRAACLILASKIVESVNESYPT